MARKDTEESKRKTLSQIIKEHRERADRAVMNSEQRLEIARIHSSAEFGGVCIDCWPTIRSALSDLASTGEEVELYGLINTLNNLYEVAK